MTEREIHTAFRADESQPSATARYTDSDLTDFLVTELAKLNKQETNMIAEKLTERTTGPVSGIRLRATDAVLPSYDPYAGDDEPTLSAIKIPFVVTTRSRLTLLSVSCFVAGAFLAAALGMLR